MPTPTAPARLSWAETRALIGSDLQRLATHLNQPDSFVHRVYFFLLPGFLALLFHRLSRYAYLRNWRWIARLLALVGLFFVLYSAIGVFMFFVPITVGEKSTIPLDHVVSWLRDNAADYVPYYALALILPGMVDKFRRLRRGR